MWIDAKSTLIVVAKPGFGKRMRHLEVAYLWLQENYLAGRLDVRKIDGIANPANVCTKHVTRADLVKQPFETTLIHMVCMAAVCREIVHTVFLSGLSRWGSHVRSQRI